MMKFCFKNSGKQNKTCQLSTHFTFHSLFPPFPRHSPFSVLAEMDRVGVDFCIDVHGDETLPYNFLSGSEGLPKWGPRLKHLQDKFGEEYKKVRAVCWTVCYC